MGSQEYKLIAACRKNFIKYTCGC